jgi:hypothetical protein
MCECCGPKCRTIAVYNPNGFYEAPENAISVNNQRDGEEEP